MKGTYSDVLKMYSASLASRILGFIGSFITARILGPTYQGLSKSVEIIQSYYPVTSLGTVNGVSRNLAMFLGKKNLEKADNTINTAFTSFFLLPFLVSISCILYPYFYKVDHLTLLIYQTTGIVTFATLLTNLNIRILNARLNFGTSASVSFISSLISTILSILFVYYYKIEGRFIGNMITVVLSLGISMLFVKHKYKFSVDISELKELLKIGFPIMSVGIIYMLILGVDRWIILLFLSMTQMGYYSIALTFSKLVGDACDALTEVIYQKINRKYGETGIVEHLYVIVMKPILVLSITFPILLGFMGIWLPFVIKFLLPKFSNGIASSQVYIWGTFFYGISINILNTINRRKIYLILQLIMFSINLVAGYLLAKEFGLIGVAIATASSFLIYSLMLSVVSLQLMHQKMKVIIKTIFKIYLPGLYTCILLLILNYTNHFFTIFSSSLIFGSIINSIILIILYIPFLPTAYKRIKNRDFQN